MQEKSVQKLEEILPEKRVRPSLLTPFGKEFSLIATASTMVLGRENAKYILCGMEKAIQEENDDQLRMFNDSEVKEEEIRKLIVEMRDDSYDHVKNTEMCIEDKKMKDDTSLQGYLYWAGKNVSSTMMKLAQRL